MLLEQEQLEHRRALNRQSYYRHREEHLARVAAYRKAHPGCSARWIRERRARMKATDPEGLKLHEHLEREKHKVVQAETMRKWRARIRAEMITNYGGKCVCCGESEPEFLSIDHINGGGRAHIKQLGNSTMLYAELKRLGFPKDKYRLLCMNCNFTFGKRGYCPHERKRLELVG